jgi:hypothetical protein
MVGPYEIRLTGYRQPPRLLAGITFANLDSFHLDRTMHLNHDPPMSVTRASAAAGTSASKPWSIGGVKLFGDDGFNFRDVLDLINPLQHIPIIGNIYRSLTGDLAAPAIRVAGGALFGGPLGAAFAAANVAMKQLVSPAPEDGPLPEAGTAIAAQREPAAPPRVGIVMNSHAFPLASPVVKDRGKPLAVTDELLLKQAYGLSEREKHARHLLARFHDTA